MKLVDDWKDAWRWWSMRGLVFLAVLPPVWISLPPDVKAMLPVEWQPWVLSVLALGSAIGRLIPQDKPE